MKPGQRRRDLLADFWRHPWGRIMIMAATVALVSIAVRETAVITLPVAGALGSVALPLAIGFTIAYILAPLVDALERWGVNRLLGAGFLFTVFGVLFVVSASFLVPVVLRQSADLARRIFQDRYYVDQNSDGRRESFEPLLGINLDAQGVRTFFIDRDGDGLRGSDEDLVEEKRVAVEPGLLAAGVQWFQGQQSRLERMVGADLDPRAMALLRLYAHYSAEVRQVLDGGLAAARAGHEPSAWPTALQEDPDRLPPVAVEWDNWWPGVLPSEFAAAREQVALAHRVRWERIMTWYGRCFALRHRQMTAAWELTIAIRAPENEASLPQVDPPPLDLPAGPAADIYRSLMLVRLADLIKGLRQPAESPSMLSGDEGRDLLASLRKAETTGVGSASRLLSRLRRDGGSDAGSAKVQSMMKIIADKAQAGLTSLSDRVTGWVTSAFTNLNAFLLFLLDCVLIPIYAFFLTMAMPRIRETMRRYLPAQGHDRWVRLMHDIERVVAAFFRGRLIVCALCGVLIWIGFALAGVPYAALFGLLIGLSTAVPLAGLIFLVPAGLLVVMGGDETIWRLSVVTGVYVIVQTLEMTVFTPMIMGREVELHPVTLIIALLLCGQLLGILGLILAVPIAATLRILAREFLLPRLRSLAELPAESRWWHKPPPPPAP